MRFNVAIGLTLLATCCLTYEGRADDSAPCCPEGGKCCEKQEAACCPTCPSTTATATGEACQEGACKACSTCPKFQDVNAEGTTCTKCTNCTEAKTCTTQTQAAAADAAACKACTKCTGEKICPSQTQEVKAEATQCNKCTGCKSCPSATQEVKTEAAACTKCTQCTGDKTCPTQTEEVKAEATACSKCTKCSEYKTCTTATSAEATNKCLSQCQGKCAPAAPAEMAGIAAQPIRVASLHGTSALRPAVALTQRGEEIRQYTVQMRMVEAEGTASEKVLSAPTVVVTEENTASIGTHASRPFVTGARKNQDRVVEPIITVLSEGTQVEVRVTALAGRRVQIDATVELSTIDGKETVESPFQTEEERETHSLQAPEVTTHSRRVVRAMELGETVKIECGCACCTSGKPAVMLLTVDQVGAPTPGITPITQASAEIEAQEEVVTEVYPVGDLLEPYAVHKAGKAVEAADFLPVIDMLLTEAKCDWPAEAKIHPFEQNQSVVISQTRAGHEAIARYLSAKRAAVAEIEANLLRK